MARIEIDLDWAGPAQRQPGDGTSAAEGTIRQDALREVIEAVVTREGTADGAQEVPLVMNIF